MKKTTCTLLFALCLLIPFSAFAKSEAIETPTLESIEFNNAVINEEFSKDIFEYTVTLDEPGVTPTLKSYKMNGSANLFVNIELDGTKHQTGILVSVEYESGSALYRFKYTNAPPYNINSNNYLKDVKCRLGEVYPAINENQTDYSLYIPSDLTQINLSPVTQDTTATCDYLKSYTLSPDQEPEIKITVIASDGSKREYTFAVKRLNKTSAQVEKEMQSPDFESLVQGELFYHKPSFYIALGCALGGIILLIAFTKIAKRLTVKIEDEDETSFFASEE